ncbi:putative amino acid transporter [Naematelia encephala]|uniref:Putative amino acid transporter n=1 Tax=Naematelia encephala TaxID=71784 RepID=A0A1Y2ASJ1_9TREE|nr:putative amino acid transporter [Naematelia encephala]
MKPIESEGNDKVFPNDAAEIHVDDVPVSSLEGSSLEARVLASVNHRRLNARQIQLTAIAGSIGAALFVAIGSGVLSGPLALLLGFLFWVTVVYSVAQCQLEIVSLFPLDGSFIRLAGRMVDPALGVAVGWNHFFAQTSYVIFEATVINTVVEYWGYDQSPAILITISLLLFLGLNVYRADLFGEAEFWLALGKVLLATGLLLYTFITMVGGNPAHDVYGFRYWKTPGPWAGTNASTRLESFLNAVNVAAFCTGGPEYISMIAGEAKDPRRTVPRAFRTIMTRLVLFFIGGSLCVGILVPYDDFTLTNGAKTYAGKSPYVISMQRLGIPVLPSIVNAALITTIISAGNAYTFNASRSLHALALDRKAPGFLRRVNKRGVPYIAVIAVMLLSCLAYLALGSTSSTVLNWILNFCTAATMFNWCVMAITWIRFNSAMKAQGIDRKEYLPVTSRFQPYAGYWALFWAGIFIWVQGYSVFLKGNWSVATFIFNYGIIALAGGIGLGFKIFQRTPFHHSKDVDLVTDLDFFDALNNHYQQEKDESPPTTIKDKLMAKLF